MKNIFTISTLVLSLFSIKAFTQNSEYSNRFYRFEREKDLKRAEKLLITNKNLDTSVLFGFNACQFYSDQYVKYYKLHKETNRDYTSKKEKAFDNLFSYSSKYIFSSARNGHLYSLWWVSNYSDYNENHKYFLSSNKKLWVYRYDENSSEVANDSAITVLKQFLRFDNFLNFRYSLNLAMRFFYNTEYFEHVTSYNYKAYNKLEDSALYYFKRFIDQHQIEEDNQLYTTKKNLKRIIKKIDEYQMDFTSNRDGKDISSYKLDTLNLFGEVILFRPIKLESNGRLFLDYQVYQPSFLGDIIFCNKRSKPLLNLILLALNSRLMDEDNKNKCVYINENLNILNNYFPEISNSWIGENGIVSENYSKNNFNSLQNAMNVYISAFNLANNVSFNNARLTGNIDDITKMLYQTEINPHSLNFLKCAANLGSESAKSLLVYYYYNYIRIRDNRELFWEQSLINKSDAIDSLIYYLNKDVTNSKQGLFLYGVLKYNGDFINISHEKGLDLIKRAYEKGDPSALYLLKYCVKNSKLSDYLNINYPWDLSVPCKRSHISHQMQTFKGHTDPRKNCLKFIKPEKIVLKFNTCASLIRISETDTLYCYSVQDDYKIKSNIWDINVKKTFNAIESYVGDMKINLAGLYCNKQCEKMDDNDTQSDYNAGNKNWERLMNEMVKCSACSNRLKLKDMLTIRQCNCIIKDSGQDIGVGFGANIKVCSKKCEIDYCKSKCAEYNYNSNY